MCTIITAEKSIKAKDICDRIRQDSLYNCDGISLLMITDEKKPVIVRSMDYETVLTLIEYTPWERVFVHLRASTCSPALLQNTHGWNTKGIFVFHNGVIHSQSAEKFDVDSQAINMWLENFGLDETIDLLHREDFANVFLVDTDKGEYFVHRSSVGTLFTDGKGNYSTNAFCDIKTPVDAFSDHEHRFLVKNSSAEEKRVYDWAFDWDENLPVNY